MYLFICLFYMYVSLSAVSLFICCFVALFLRVFVLLFVCLFFVDFFFFWQGKLFVFLFSCWSFSFLCLPCVFIMYAISLFLITLEKRKYSKPECHPCSAQNDHKISKSLFTLKLYNSSRSFWLSISATILFCNASVA